MVRVSKLAGDFNVAEIRESFMRQFGTLQLDLVMDTEDNMEQRQSFVKKAPLNLVKSPQIGVRSGGYMEKQLGIANVIRCKSFVIKLLFILRDKNDQLYQFSI